MRSWNGTDLLQTLLGQLIVPLILISLPPDGLVFRCCWTGGHYYDKNSDRFYYPLNFEKLFNGFKIPIEDILNYKYWNKLDQYLQGYDRSFKLCKSQCGKIVSSREKIEENLLTGNTKIFSAGMGYGT